MLPRLLKAALFSDAIFVAMIIVSVAGLAYQWLSR